MRAPARRRQGLHGGNGLRMRRATELGDRARWPLHKRPRVRYIRPSAIVAPSARSRSPVALHRVRNPTTSVPAGVPNRNARQRPARRHPRGPRIADRRGPPDVPRRLAPRAGGTHRARAPARAPALRRDRALPQRCEFDVLLENASAAPTTAPPGSTGPTSTRPYPPMPSSSRSGWSANASRTSSPSSTRRCSSSSAES
jgi:hypothetical protein